MKKVQAILPEQGMDPTRSDHWMGAKSSGLGFLAARDSRKIGSALEARPGLGSAAAAVVVAGLPGTVERLGLTRPTLEG